MGDAAVNSDETRVSSGSKTATSDGRSSDSSEFPFPTPLDVTVPTPSESTRKVLTLLVKLAAVPAPDASGVIPAATQDQRSRLYERLYEQLKPSNYDASGSEIPPTPETPDFIKWVGAALPKFYEQALHDIQCAAPGPAPSQTPAASAPPAATAVVAAPRRCDFLLARVAVKCLGYFLHHPQHLPCFPVPRATAALRKQAREAISVSNDPADAAAGTALADASVASVSSDPLTDGFDVLASVLSRTPDRTLACIICWLYAEQTLTSASLVHYIDGAIDAFEAALLRCQQADAAAAASAAASAAAASAGAAAVAAGSRAASPALPSAQQHPFMNSSLLNQEIVHALFKFGRLCLPALRLRALRNDPARPEPLRWLQVLVIEPYLSPSAFFACSASPTPVATAATVSAASTAAPSVASSTSAPVSVLSKEDAAQRVRLRDISMQLVRGVLDGCFLARNTGPSSPGLGLFARAFHARAGAAGKGWVKAVAAEVAARAALLEAERNEARKLEKEEARSRERGLVKIEGAPSKPGAGAAVATTPSAAVARYEQRLSALYLETFQLLRLYLAATGTLLASAPAIPGVAASPPPVNAFLSFIQPLFNSQCVAVRSIVFPEMWAYVCRALSADEKARQDEEDAAFAAAAATAAAAQGQVQPQASTAGGDTKVTAVVVPPSKPQSVSNSRRFLALVMKPFAHHLPKDSSPAVIGSLLRSWLTFVAEHFLSLLPRAPPATGGAPNLAPGAPHRIAQQHVYEEVMAKLLTLLVPPTATAVSSGTVAEQQQRAKTQLTFEEHLDSHARAAVWEEILEAWKCASSADAFAEEVPTSTCTPSASASTSASGSLSSGSSSSTIAQASHPYALLYLPSIAHALLDQPVSSPTRVAFVTWATGAVSRAMARIQGNTERRAAMELYGCLVRSAAKAAVLAQRNALMSSALAMHSNGASSSSSAAAVAPAPSSVALASPAAAAAPSMLHVLYHAWVASSSSSSSAAGQGQGQGQGQACPLLQQPGPGAVLAPSKAEKVLFGMLVQRDALAAWMAQRATLEPLRGLDLPGPSLAGSGPAPAALPHVSSSSASDAGYNATPTPLSAPTPGASVAGGASGAAAQAPPMSPFLSSLISAWFGFCAPLLEGPAQAALGSSAAERARERFLEGLGALCSAHLDRVNALHTSQSQQSYQQRQAQARPSSMHCLQGLLESLLRTYSPRPGCGGLAALVWEVHLHAQAHLLREVVPQAARLGGAQAGSPEFGPSGTGASLESGGAGAGGGGPQSAGSASSHNNSSSKASKEHTPARVAAMLSDMALLHMSEEADAAQALWLHDPAAAPAARAAFEASEAARADQAVEMLVASLLLPTRFPALAAAVLPSPDASPNGAMAAFASGSTLLAQLSLLSSDEHDHDDGHDGLGSAPLPDVMALLTSGILDVLREHGNAASASGFGLVVRLAHSCVAELHAARSGGGARPRPSPQPFSSTPLGNWKQWKGHAHAGLQKVVNALLEQGVRRGLEQQQQQQASAAPTDAAAMVDVAAAAAPSQASPVSLEISSFLPFVNGLIELFSRLPCEGSSLDGIAWLLRLMPSFHALLRALNGAPEPSAGADAADPSASSPLAPVVTAAVRLWSAALSAFRVGWQGRPYDFGLLQEVVAKIPVAAATATAAAASATPSAEVLFIDMLTLSLSHSHAAVRAAALQFWTHTFAVRRSASSASPLSRLHFHAHPEFTSACRARCDAGELQDWQVPLTAAQQAEAAAAAQAAATRTPTAAPSSLQSSPQHHHLLASPSAGAGAIAIVPSASTPSRSVAANATRQSWAPLSISPMRMHFEQKTANDANCDAAAADNADEAMVDADDMGLTGMMNDAAADVDAVMRADSPSAAAGTMGSAAVSAEKSLRISPSILSSPPPSTPAAAAAAATGSAVGSAIAASPSSTIATNSGGGGGASGNGAFSSSHSFLPSHRFSKRRTNLLDRMAAVAPELPSDLVAAAPSAQGAAASPPARPERMERTASQDQAAMEAGRARERQASEQQPEPEPEPEPEASASRRDTLSPFPATPARAVSASAPARAAFDTAAPAGAATGASQSVPPPPPASLSVRLLSEFDQAAAAEATETADVDAAAALGVPAEASSTTESRGATSSHPAAYPAAASQGASQTAKQPSSDAATASKAAETENHAHSDAAVTDPKAAPTVPAPASAPALLAPASATADEDIAQSLSLPMCSSISQPQAHVDADDSQEDADEPAKQRPAVSVAAEKEKQASQPRAEPQPVDAAGVAVLALPPVGPIDTLRTHSQPSPPSARTAPKHPTSLSEPILSGPRHAMAPSEHASAHESEVEAHSQDFVPPIMPSVSVPSPAAAAAATPAEPDNSVAADAKAVVTEAPAESAAPAPVLDDGKAPQDEVAAANKADADPTAMDVDAAAPADAPAASSSLPPLRGTKRALEASTPSSRGGGDARSTSPSSKRVMFSERHNVAISPSPLFSTLSPSTGSIGASAGMDGDADADSADPHMEKGTSEGSSSDSANAVVHFNLTPLSPADRDGHAVTAQPALTRAEKAQQRTDALQLHAERKAQLKLRANPIDSTKAGPPAPILKRPASLQSQPGTGAEFGAAPLSVASSAPSLHPSLSGSLAPLSHLLSCFALPAAGKACGTLLASSLRMATVGDVAACSADHVRAGIVAAPTLMDGCLSEFNAEADATSIAVQLIRDALANYEEKQLKPQRKRKQPAAGEPVASAAATAKSDVAADAIPPPTTAAQSDDAPTLKKARVESDAGPAASASQIVKQQEQQSAADRALVKGDSVANLDPAAAPAAVVSATAGSMISPPAFASLVKQLSTSRASSFSASELSCGSGGPLSNSSPVIPFVAPEFTCVASAAASSVALVRPVPQTAATTVDTDATAAVAAPLAAPQSTSQATPPSAASASPVATFAAPTMHAAVAPADDSAAAAALPQVAAPGLPAASVAVAAPAPSPPALASSPPVADVSMGAGPAELAIDVDMGDILDADALQEEEEDSGPLGVQMGRLRFHLCSSMSTLFAPVQPPHLPVEPRTPMQSVNAAIASPPPAPTAGASSAMLGSNVVAELNLTQLREIASYVAAIQVAVQKQLRRRERSEAIAFSRRESLVTPSRMRRADSAAATAGPPSPTR